MNEDRLALKLIIAHFKTQKWFLDDLAEYNEAKDLRNRRATELARRAEDIGAVPPKMKQILLAELREQIEKEVV